VVRFTSAWLTFSKLHAPPPILAGPFSSSLPLSSSSESQVRPSITLRNIMLTTFRDMLGIVMRPEYAEGAYGVKTHGGEADGKRWELGSSRPPGCGYLCSQLHLQNSKRDMGNRSRGNHRSSKGLMMQKGNDNRGVSFQRRRDNYEGARTLETVTW